MVHFNIPGYAVPYNRNILLKRFEQNCALVKAMVHVAVLVVGDIGRSPRMQYHALSLSKLDDMQVSLVGYRGEQCIDQVETTSTITKYTFTPWTFNAPKCMFIVYAPFKVIFQVFQVIRYLYSIANMSNCLW